MVQAATSRCGHAPDSHPHKQPSSSASAAGALRKRGAPWQWLMFALIGLSGTLCGLAIQAPMTAADRQDGVLLDFTAPWCGPCQQMSPIIHRLEQQGYPIQKIDVDRQRDLASKYNVTNIPCFVLVINGREVNRITGQTSENQLRRLLLQIPSSSMTTPSDQRQAAASTAPSTIESPTFTGSSGATNNAAPSRSAADPAVSLGSPRNNAGRRSNPKDNSVAAADTKSGRSPFKFGGGLFPKRAKGEVEPPPVVRAQGQEDVDANELATQLASSVRIRVRDAKGSNYGSGTIIDSRVGQTLVLTCGHIFRKSDDASRIEADVFLPGGRSETYQAELVAHDLKGDVGLIMLPTAGVLPIIPLAARDAAAGVGESLSSIGCGGGDKPSRQNHRVTALNRYEGPENIECSGVPQQGRSGGGLFREGKQLVGVCILADPEEQRGLYAGLKPIHDLLEAAGYRHLIPVLPRGIEVADARGSDDQAAGDDLSLFNSADPGRKPSAARGSRQSRQDEAEQMFDSMVREANPVVDSLDSLAESLGEHADAEVVCLIRSRDRNTASKIVVINQASTKLLSHLFEGQLAPLSRPTSLRVED